MEISSLHFFIKSNFLNLPPCCYGNNKSQVFSKKNKIRKISDISLRNTPEVVLNPNCLHACSITLPMLLPLKLQKT